MAAKVNPLPGTYIRQEMQVRSWSIHSTAKWLNISQDELWALMNGYISVDTDLAIRLGKLFRTSYRYWICLQAVYDQEDNE